MAITRIRFSNNSNGADPYTLVLNPVRMEVNDSEDYSSIQTLDGTNVKQNIVFDSRPMSFFWTSIPSDFTGFAGMLGTLKSYIDSQKYVHYGTADYRISPTATWNLVRVADVKIGALKGGKIKYNVELVLFPESL